MGMDQTSHSEARKEEKVRRERGLEKEEDGYWRKGKIP